MEVEPDMVYLITGCAGFIGSNLAARALELGNEVVGIDNLNSYYDPALKSIRISSLRNFAKFDFIEGDVNNQEILNGIGQSHNISNVYHMAAQAGVRLQAENYSKYIESNVSGFTSVLNFVIKSQIPNFIYASSSSVYGNTEDLIFNETTTDTNPTSYYGSTKLFNEKIASVMVRNSDTRARGLRFFTVYGEMGRPDMAYFRIANAILNDKKFNLFGDGKVKRDFTYIHDVVETTLALGAELATREKGYADIVNIGGGRPVSMNELISEITRQLGKAPEIMNTAANENDVELTKADTSKLYQLVGFTPETKVEEGIGKFLTWARSEEIRTKLDGWVNSAP
jgi:UDP-glucuronate 4-epimerase